MFTSKEQAIVNQALAILESTIKATDALTSSQVTVNYVRLRIGGLPHEMFSVLWLDNQHQLIAMEDMFRGTIDGAAVYPREVVKSALQHNAAAAIFAHNHPSGVTDPSAADIAITRRLKTALEVVDIRVLDHIIVSAIGHTSFAERGLI